MDLVLAALAGVIQHWAVRVTLTADSPSVRVTFEGPWRPLPWRGTSASEAALQDFLDAVEEAWESVQRMDLWVDSQEVSCLGLGDLRDHLPHEGKVTAVFWLR